MRSIIAIILISTSISMSAQTLDTVFFPQFTSYTQNPIINYGDDLFGSPWNDPCVLKESNQYIMYTSGTEGGLNHPDDTLAIYRWFSSDGYSWSLNPKEAVLKSVSGTYYEGAVETPSVVFYKGQYHMYNTVYTQNVATKFKISHATSSDGINWKMDANQVLEPTSNPAWMGQIIAEPGVMVKSDTLYLFFTAISLNGVQSIGLARSIDGSNFIDTIQAVFLPEEVYPLTKDYIGLSTPSPVMIGDTIYLFTDVAQWVRGNWTQVALHQFKSYGDITKWYHDSIPIHTLQDFPWTSGNYQSEIRAINPLLDGNRLRIWYSGHRISEIDTITNDTINHVHFIGNELHVDSGYWGIGTSEFVFNNLNSIVERQEINGDITINYSRNQGSVESTSNSTSRLCVYTINGQLLLSKSFVNTVSFCLEYHGLILISVTTESSELTEKALSY